MFAARTTAMVAMAAVSFPAAALAQSAADRELRAAEAAIAAQNWDDALAALERAYLAEEDPYILYRRILVLEQMGEPALALEVLRENRDSLLESDRVNDLVVVEERLQSAPAAEVVAVEPAPAPASNPWPVLSLATGGVIAATGGVLLFLGGRNLAQLRCSDFAAGGEVCVESSGLEVATASDFEARTARASTMRSVGAVLLPVGLALGVTGYLLTSSKGAAVTLGTSGTGLALRVSFR